MTSVVLAVTHSGAAALGVVVGYLFARRRYRNARHSAIRLRR